MVNIKRTKSNPIQVDWFYVFILLCVPLLLFLLCKTESSMYRTKFKWKEKLSKSLRSKPLYINAHLKKYRNERKKKVKRDKLNIVEWICWCNAMQFMGFSSRLNKKKGRNNHLYANAKRTKGISLGPRPIVRLHLLTTVLY